MMELVKNTLAGFDVPTTLVLCLGMGLVITGFISLHIGRTWFGHKGYWRPGTVERSKEPTLFWCVVILLYWAFGWFLIVCSVISALQNIGYVARPLVQ